LIAGDDLTGITIMAMEEGLDTGPILLQQALPIAPDATAASLSEALGPLGGELVLAALAAAQSGDLASQPQPQTGVTYAHRIEREEGRLDWRQSAEALERRIRALDPWPGAFFEYRGEHIRVHAAAVAPSRSDKPPGTVLDVGLSVACGSGALRLLKLQRPGRAALGVALFLRGYPIAEGTRLPCPATS
jgi:methionyl-tRNA formyltransferase